MTPRRSSARPQSVATRRQLENELHELRTRLAEAEATLNAIRSDEVDALVVVTREHGAEEVLTLGGAHIPWRHFVEEMRDGALTVAEDGTILHANHQLSDMAGRDHVVGQPLATLFDAGEALHVLLQNAGDHPRVSDSALRCADGTRLPVELSVTVLPLAGVRRIGIVVRSRTPPAERARNIGTLPERQARSPSAHLEAALAHVPIGLVCVDARSGTVTYANRRAEEILGRSLVGQERPLSHVELTSWRVDGTVVEPEHLPSARVLRGEGVVREDLASVRDDGAIVQTRTTAVPVNDAVGRLASVVLTFEDITEETAARAERDSNDRFRELFIGMLGHDLRDPLTTVVTGSHLLRGRLAGPDEQRILARVEASAGRMGRLIEQILDFARARLGGGIPIVRAPVELQALVGGIVADFRASHPDRIIELDFEATCSGEWDADRLVQVLSNLVGNALDHGDRGRPVRVWVRDEGAGVRIDIHNDGAPISPAFLPVIFDPFRRDVAAGGKRSTGVGLGLYIAQQIVHAHGGTLSVVSTAEEGTNFTAVLPCASALPPESSPRPR